MDYARRQGIFPDFLETVAGVDVQVNGVLGAQKTGNRGSVYFRQFFPYQRRGDPPALNQKAR
jgi:hypothetical protein